MRIALFINKSHIVPNFLEEYADIPKNRFDILSGSINIRKRAELAELLESGEWQEKGLKLNSTEDIGNYLKCNRNKIYKDDSIACVNAGYFYYRPRCNKYSLPAIYVAEAPEDCPWTIYSPVCGTEYIQTFEPDKETGFLKQTDFF